MNQKHHESKQEPQQVEVILPQPQIRCGSCCQHSAQVIAHAQATFRIQKDPGSIGAIKSATTRFNINLTPFYLIHEISIASKRAIEKSAPCSANASGNT